jgi:hypothetical protein
MTNEVVRYHHTFRRTLLDMHIPDWDPGFLAQYEPEKLADAYAATNISGVLFYCKSHMGLNYWPVPVGGVHPAAKDRDLVGEMLAALRARGIAPAAYHTVIFDNWATEHHPEWAIVPATTLKGYDSHLFGPKYGTACATKPGYRAYEREQITALLQRYDFDALWIDMVFWTGLCVCEDCRERFRSEDGEEIPLVLDWESPAWARFQAARERWLEELTVELIDAAHQARPGIAVTHNLAPGTLGWFTGQKLRWGRHDTFVAGDLYGGRDEQLVISKVMLHLGQQQPAEFMTSRTLNLRNHTALKSEHMMLVEALGTTAHSCAFLFIDAIDPRGTFNRGVYERIGRVFEETARYEAFLGGSQVEDVAVYYSDDSRIVPDDSGTPLPDVRFRPGELPHLQAVTGAATQLQHAHIPFGVITRNDLGHLDRYRAVVLPDVLRMDDDELQAFRSYVEGGGCLYASGRTSVLGVDGVRRADFGLADVFGAHIDGTEEGSGIYLRARSPRLADAMQPEEFFGYGFPASAFDGYPKAGLGMPRLGTACEGVALATLNVPYAYPSAGSRDAHDFASIHASPPWQDLDNPAIVEHRFGHGRCIYSVVPIETDGTEAGMGVFTALVTDLLGGPPTIGADAGPDVWVTAFDQPTHDRVVISVLRYQTEARPAPFAIKFTYRLPADRRCTAVRVAVSGAQLPFEVDGAGTVTVTVDAVDLFGMYLIQHQAGT